MDTSTIVVQEGWRAAAAGGCGYDETAKVGLPNVARQLARLGMVSASNLQALCALCRDGARGHRRALRRDRTWAGAIRARPTGLEPGVRREALALYRAATSALWHDIDVYCEVASYPYP